jgi:hypothetical protein
MYWHCYHCVPTLLPQCTDTVTTMYRHCNLESLSYQNTLSENFSCNQLTWPYTVRSLLQYPTLRFSEHCPQTELLHRCCLTCKTSKQSLLFLFYKLLWLRCNATNLRHCLPSVYSVTTSLHVSGLLVAHHQEVTMYIRDNWYVLYMLVDRQQATRRTARTNCHIYTLLPPDDGLLASLKHVDV